MHCLFIHMYSNCRIRLIYWFVKSVNVYHALTQAIRVQLWMGFGRNKLRWKNVFDTLYKLIYGTELFDIIASFALREFPFHLHNQCNHSFHDFRTLLRNHKKHSVLFSRAKYTVVIFASLSYWNENSFLIYFYTLSLFHAMCNGLEMILTVSCQCDLRFNYICWTEIVMLGFLSIGW